MKKFLLNFLCFLFIFNYIFKTEQVKALVPYYYLPTTKNLEKQSLSIGRNAYQLLYFGQIKDSLNLARLAVKINKNNEKLWLILSEAQIANNLYEDALLSLKKAQKINSDLIEIYFSKSTIYLKQSNLEEAKKSLESGLKIAPKNRNAIFQLGNIFLMETNFLQAIKYFNKAIKIKPDFWQAQNNNGLAYFELGNIDQSIQFFKEAISIQDNAEPLLGLASCLIKKDIDKALQLARKALKKDPRYVEYSYRKEQLWGSKLQNAAEKLFKNKQIQKEVEQAKLENQ